MQSGPLSPGVGRVFSSAKFGLGIMLLAFSAVGGYGLYNDLQDGHRIRLAIVVLVPLLLIAGMAGFMQSVSRGCLTCKAQLKLRGYRYPATMLHFLRQTLATGGPGLDAFRRAPADTTGDAAKLKIELCPKCGRVAMARVDHEHFGESNKLLEKGPERRLADQELWLVQALGQERTADDV